MKYNLSEISAVIQDRRSIAPENYTDRKVHREIIEDVLNNAKWAPTHGMVQPWRFKVYLNDKVLPKAIGLIDVYKAVISEDQWSQRKIDKMQKRAESISTLTFICMSPDENVNIPEIENVEAVACAVQNMYLTCTAYGLGCYWSSPKFIYSPEMNEFLGLAENEKCLGIFYMGYPSMEWPKSHRKPLEYITEWFE